MTEAYGLDGRRPPEWKYNPATGEEEPVKHGAIDPIQMHHFKLIPFGQIGLGTEGRYLIKGLVPYPGLTIAWGPPKSGKSFVVFDMLMHVALGWTYRSKKVKGGPVVYCAFEGQGGVRARAEAFRQRFLSETAEEVPLYLMPVTLDLVAEHPLLIRLIQQELGEQGPVAVCLDTLNRSLNGSESRDEDMTAYIRACDTIRDAFECSVIVVHHCGIEGTRPRGHTSLTGAADAQIAIKRGHGDTITATVEWMKDGPEGESVTSKLESVEVGQDDEGEAITSCVVVAAQEAPSEPRRAKLAPNHQTMLTLLTEAMPDGMTVEEWNEKARKDAGMEKTPKQRFYDWRMALKEKRLAHEYAGRWYVTSQA